MAASTYDSIEAFAQLFASCRLPAVVQEKIMGLHETPLELHFAFQGKAEVMEERRGKTVLMRCSLAELKLDEEDRLTCGMAGKVRRLLHEVDPAVASERAPATRPPSTMHQGEEISLLVTGQAILQERVAPVISIPDYERVIARVKVECLCELLLDATTPGRA